MASLAVVCAAADVAADCSAVSATPGLQRFYSDGWGIDARNTRHQNAQHTSIDATNVSRLKLKWSYALATDAPRSMPLVTEDSIFIGDSGRGLLALDRETVACAGSSSMAAKSAARSCTSCRTTAQRCSSRIAPKACSP